MIAVKKMTSCWWCGLIGLVALVTLLLPSSVQAAEFGVNIHSLSRELPENIASILNFVNQNCNNTTYVRLWGYEGTMGVNGYTDLEKVIDNTPSGVKLIVALEDFPNGPIPSDNPVSAAAWYEQARIPSSKYYQFVERMMEKYAHFPQVAVWELANEPHCLDDAACEVSFLRWVETISNRMADFNPVGYISAGLMGGHLDWGTYLAQANLPNITATSCHYNLYTNNTETCQTAMNNRGNTAFFYVGEAGYRADGEASCTSRGCTNVCDLATLSVRATEILSDFGTLASADAFLVWQFSPLANTLLICDEFSIFP
ncbi:hypothetical protein MUP65_02485, partial [Patescibacteria group bacterium]|nr:hypothetical protein [Patescibacteria group bacterium]